MYTNNLLAIELEIEKKSIQIYYRVFEANALFHICQRMETAPGSMRYAEIISTMYTNIRKTFQKL